MPYAGPSTRTARPAPVSSVNGRRVALDFRRFAPLLDHRIRLPRHLRREHVHREADHVGKRRVSTDLDDAADAQLVLEAVPADRAVQDEVYGRLDAICAPPAVFASGSGQPASELVSNVAHRERMVAAHFW